MPSRLVQHGRIRGYRPTLPQLQELLDLAQRGIDDPGASASLVCSQGNLEFYTEKKLTRILPKHVDEVIAAAGNPKRLYSLNFSAWQESLSRRVEIEIGAGEWTVYRVESGDQTWAHGRYHELTESILQHRGLYAKYAYPAPQVLKMQTVNRWRDVPREPIQDRRVRLVGTICSIPRFLPLMALIGFIYGLYSVYQQAGGQPNPPIEDLNLSLAHNLILFAALVTVTYILTIVPYSRWLRSLLISNVLVKKPSFLEQFSFRNNDVNPVELASLYAVCVGIIVSVIVPFL